MLADGRQASFAVWEDLGPSGEYRMEKTTIQLYNFVMELMTDPAESWDFWRWKMDPFKLPAGAAADPDAVIRLYRGADEEVPDPEELELKDSKKLGFFTYTICLDPNGAQFWFVDRPAKKQRVLTFRIDREWKDIRLLEDRSGTGGELAFETLSRLLPGILLKRSVLQLHAALVEDCGRGILICADSGVGKTTHARLWRDHKGSIIIDGDRATCVRDGSRWIAFGIPWCGTSGEYMNRSVPIKAVVILDRGKTNEVRRLDGLEPFFGALPHLQYPAWVPELANRGMDLLQSLTEEIPVLHLSCRPDVQAVETLEAALREL